MSWQTYYFFTSIIIAIAAFQAGRSFESRDIEKDFLQMKEQLAQNWMSCEKGK